MTTFYKAITSVDGNIELSTVMSSSSGKWIPPSLSWFNEDMHLRKDGEGDYFWDNDDYLECLFVALKKRKKNQYTKELKKFCILHDLNFKETKKILRKIYKQSKKHGFWDFEKD